MPVVAILRFCVLGVALLSGPAGATQATGAKSLYNKYFSKPTGRNGYEEYLQAADMAYEPHFKELSYQITSYESLRKPDSARYLAAWAKGKSKLELVRMRAARAGKILLLIAKGNGKPVALPPLVNTALQSETVRALRDINRIAVSVARVRIEEGDVSAGARLLVTQLRFAHRLRTLDVLHDISGGGSEESVLGAFNMYLDRFIEEDWRLVVSTARQQLGGATPLAKAFLAESQQNADRCKATLESIEPAAKVTPKSKDEDTYPEITEFARQDRTERKRTVAEVLGLLRRRFHLAAAIARGPESKWPLGKQYPKPRTLTERLATPWSPLLDMYKTEGRHRTQLRLLLVHGLIRLYRLQHHRLPVTLNDLHSPREIIDPFYREPFVYKVDNGTYDLYSKGVGDSGKLQLRWLRPKRLRDD